MQCAKTTAALIRPFKPAGILTTVSSPAAGSIGTFSQRWPRALISPPARDSLIEKNSGEFTKLSSAGPMS